MTISSLGSSFNSVKLSDQLRGRIQQSLRFGHDPSDVATKLNLPLVAILGIEKSMAWSDKPPSEQCIGENHPGVLQKKKIGRPKGSKNKNRRVDAMSLPTISLEREVKEIKQSLHAPLSHVTNPQDAVEVMSIEVTKLRKQVKLMRKLIITLLSEDK